MFIKCWMNKLIVVCLHDAMLLNNKKNQLDTSNNKKESDKQTTPHGWIFKSQFWKRSVFIPIPKKGNAKECSNYHTIALISYTSKVMLKILQARLQQYVNCELLMFKLVLEKAEEPEIKLPTSAGSWKKQESSRKTSISALLTMPKPLTVWERLKAGGEGDDRGWDG